MRLPRLSIFLSVLWLGCGAPARFPRTESCPADAVPGQITAERVVWAERMGMGPLRPPAVSWERGDMDCGEAAPGHRCVGLFWAQSWTARVTWRGSIHGSSYAHELLHAGLYLLQGDADGDHDDPAWGGWLDGTNARLEAMGL